MTTNWNNALKVSDIVEINWISPTKSPNNIWEEVIFDIKSRLEGILENVFQQFKINKKENDSDNPIYSLIDVRNFRWLSVNEIQTLFVNNFQINLESNNWIEKFNEYYNLAIRIIESRYWRIANSAISNRKINNIQDIKDILEKTWVWKTWVFYCAIAKIFLSIISLKRDVRITHIWKIWEEITDHILKPIQDSEQLSEGIYKWVINIDESQKSVPIKVYNRTKSLYSCVWKQIWNIDYWKVDDFKDLHWYTLEIDSTNSEDYILLLQRYYLSLRDKARKSTSDYWEDNEYEIEIENKWLITLNDVDNCKEKLDQDFYDILILSIQQSESKAKKKKEQKWTNEKYRDVKIELKYKTKDPRGKDYKDVYSWVEIKIVQAWNDNEKWLSFHPVFDYKKRFRELTRLFWFITKFDIVNYTNEFFDNLDNELSKKWLVRWKYLKELVEELRMYLWNNFTYRHNDIENLLEIKKAFYMHLESELVKVKITKDAKNYFYVHKSYFNLTPELQPELIEIKQSA